MLGEELAKFEIQHLQALKEIIESQNIKCEFELKKTCDVWINEEEANLAKTNYEKMMQNGFSYMEDVQYFEGREAEEVRQFINVNAQY